ncbi:MAG: hypothetical protein LBK95_13115 [Bifidobacteriaceae bacterium]|nr:hypothetical protein [Bifidobacteriaceae bacterium]
MPQSRPNSYCTSGLPVDFYWYGCATSSLADNVQAAVDALVEAISRPGREWSRYNTAMVRAEFAKCRP